MDTVLIPKDFLEQLASLKLPQDRLARVDLLDNRGCYQKLTANEQLELDAWTALRDQFATLSAQAQAVLGTYNNPNPNFIVNGS